MLGRLGDPAAAISAARPPVLVRHALLCDVPCCRAWRFRGHPGHLRWSSRRHRQSAALPVMPLQVARPGLSAIAGSLAVELMAAVLAHPDGAAAPAPGGGVPTGLGAPTAAAAAQEELPLGQPPHMIRGQLGGFSQMCLAGQAFSQCTACSRAVVREYRRHGARFVLKVCCAGPGRGADVCGVEPGAVRRLLGQLLTRLLRRLAPPSPCLSAPGLARPNHARSFAPDTRTSPRSLRPHPCLACCSSRACWTPAAWRT